MVALGICVVVCIIGHVYEVSPMNGTSAEGGEEQCHVCGEKMIIGW